MYVGGTIVILAVNGIDLTERVRSLTEVVDLVRSTKPGIPLILDIMRTIEDDETMPPGVKAPAATSERSNDEDAVSASSKEVSSKTTPPKEVPAKKASPKEVSSTKAVKKDTPDQNQAAPASQQSPTAPGSATKRGRKKKDPNAPKGPTNAYVYFMSEMRSKLPGTNSSDALAHIGKQWKELTPEQKKKYEDLSEKDKERYRKEMAEYKAKNQGTEGAGLAQSRSQDEDKGDPTKGDQGCRFFSGECTTSSSRNSSKSRRRGNLPLEAPKSCWRFREDETKVNGDGTSCMRSRRLHEAGTREGEESHVSNALVRRKSHGDGDDDDEGSTIVSHSTTFRLQDARLQTQGTLAVGGISVQVADKGKEVQKYMHRG